MISDLEKTQNKFRWRESLDEFLTEHPVVMDLYQAVLSSTGIALVPQEQLLRVFNYAYYICMKATQDGVHTVDEAITPNCRIWMSRNRPLYSTLLFAVAFTLLRVHVRVVSFDVDLLNDLNSRISENFDHSNFTRLVLRYAGMLEKPLNFSGRLVEVPVEHKGEADDPVKLIARAKEDMARIEEWVMALLAEKETRIRELEGQLQQALDEKAALSKQMEKALTAQDALERQMKRHLGEQDKATKQMEQLRQEVERLERKASEAVRLPAYLQEEVARAINSATIHDYACGLRDVTHAAVISTMMSNLVLKYHVNCPELHNLILNIDKVQATKNTPRPTPQINCERYIGKLFYNDNKDSMVFNGQVSNNQFK